MPSKRELDKQNMFRKIMPTAAAAAPKSSGANLTPEEISALLAANADETSQAPQTQTEPVEISSAQITTDASQDKKLSGKDIAAIYATKHIEVQNELELENQPAQPQEPYEYNGQPTVYYEEPSVDEYYQPTPPENEFAPSATPQENEYVQQEDAASANSEPEEEPYPVNIAELLVKDNYPRYAKRLNACMCDECREEVFGIALNQIRPRYVPSNELQNTNLNERELVTEVVTALMRAIFTVNKNPPHA